MRRALVMWCVLALAACRSGGEPAPPADATPPAATVPPVATAPPEPAPRESSPPRGSAPGRTAPGEPQCQKDADCALTLVPEGDCCPRLCAPRAVTLEEARRVDERVRRCEQENHPCVMPNCRARAFEPACVRGACSARLADDR